MSKKGESREEQNPLQVREQDLERVKVRWQRGWGHTAASDSKEPEVDIMADDDDGWQEMPVMRTINDDMEAYNVLDEEDRKRLHFRVPSPDRVATLAKELPSPLPSQSKHGRTGSKAKHRSLQAGPSNATGQTLDVHDARGYEWRARPDEDLEKELDEEDDAQLDTTGPGRGYTQVHLDEDEEAEQLYAATEYLFGSVDHNPFSEKPAVDAASQMNTAKGFLSEGQRIAYVGLCALLARQVSERPLIVPAPPEGSKKPSPSNVGKPDPSLAAARDSGNAWITDVLAKLYLHMDIAPPEQSMIAQLGQHGVLPTDLAPTLITTQVIDNPDFDPEALIERERDEKNENEVKALSQAVDGARSTTPTPGTDQSLDEPSIQDVGHSSNANNRSPESKPTLLDPNSAAQGNIGDLRGHTEWGVRNTHKNMAPLQMHGTNDPASASTADPVSASTTGSAPTEEAPNAPAPNALAGVSTEVTAADKTITLDLRWTVLCDLFLLVTFDADYDARSRTLLEEVATAMGLTTLDVTKFETRIAETLEIDDGAARHLRLRDRQAIQKRAAAAKRKRLLMMGLATIGGGVVLGLSAGLLAPFIGAGLGAAFTTIGVGGTSAFFGGAGGAAVITTTATVAGSSMAGKSMHRRTRAVSVFEFKPVHNNNRFRCIIGIPGFMNGEQDDPRLPFSKVDSMMGDLFSVLWEPDLMREMGAAMGILWNETVAAGIQQLLAATVAGSLIGALAWPLWLTKLSYLIDNPWSNSLDRAKAAGLILADVIQRRQMGSRPLTLVAFSLGARVIFYALRELHRANAFGLVQDVYLVGAPVTASDKVWRQVRSIVAGRFVNGFSKTDWILGYLHRATSGGLASVAGLHPITGAPGVDNVDLTQIVPGHLAYRALMPLVLGELGFRTTADYFDEPEDLSKVPEREVRPMTEEELREAMKELNYNSGGNASDNANGAAVVAAAHAAHPPPPPPAPAPAKKNPFASFFKRNKKSNSTSDVCSAGIPSPKPDFHPEAVTPTTAPDYDYDYDEDVDEPREDDAPLDDVDIRVSSTSADKRPSSLTSTATAASRFDSDAILAELRSAGIEVKELPSSMPRLDAKSPPARSTTMPAAKPSLANPTEVARSMSLAESKPSLPPSSPRNPSAPLPENLSSVWGSGVDDLAPPVSAYGSSNRLPAMGTHSVRRESDSITSQSGLAWAAGSTTHLPTLSSLSSSSLTLGPQPAFDSDLRAEPGTLDNGSLSPGAAPLERSSSSVSTPKDLSTPWPAPPPPALTFGGADGEIMLQEEENPWG